MRGEGEMGPMGLMGLMRASAVARDLRARGELAYATSAGVRDTQRPPRPEVAGYRGAARRNEWDGRRPSLQD